MRLKALAIFTVIFMLLVCGCEKDSSIGPSESVPSYNERFETVSESDINGIYSVPMFKNMAREDAQSLINDTTLDMISLNRIKTRKNKAVGFLAGTDLTDYSFVEIGVYKIYCNDGKYISFSLSFEQRFINKDKFEFVKQNNVFNYNAITGEAVDAASLFVNEKEVSEYIAKKLYERLLNMDCLETGEYSNEIFCENVLDYCAILPANKIAVVTTSGLFDLKLSAGAPVVEISIPEEYYLKTKH